MNIKTMGSLLILSALQLSACGQKSEVPEFYADLVPVSGTVRLKDQPLAGAAITFSPIGDQAVRAAYALTDAEGKYSAMTPIHGIPASKTKGAVPGEYRVVISKLAMSDGKPVPPDVPPADAMLNGATESLPPKYSSEAQSVLKAKVEKGAPQDSLNFSLQ